MAAHGKPIEAPPKMRPRLHFDIKDAQGMDGVEVGDRIMMDMDAEVVSMSQEYDEHGKLRRSMALEIHGMKSRGRNQLQDSSHKSRGRQEIR